MEFLAAFSSAVSVFHIKTQPFVRYDVPIGTAPVEGRFVAHWQVKRYPSAGSKSRPLRYLFYSSGVVRGQVRVVKRNLRDREWDGSHLVVNPPTLGPGGGVLQLAGDEHGPLRSSRSICASRAVTQSCARGFRIAPVVLRRGNGGATASRCASAAKVVVS